MTEDEVRALIAAGEGQTVEFKQTPSQLPKGIRTLGAFASQPQGGSLIFGVRDDRKILGLTIAANKVQQIADTIKRNVISMTTAAPLLPEIYTFEPPGLLVVHVPAGTHDQGPFVAFGKRYQRVGQSTHEFKRDYAQLVAAFNNAITDDAAALEEPFPYRFCPDCGSTDLHRRRLIDYAHDEAYYVIECAACDWSDWTQ